MLPGMTLRARLPFPKIALKCADVQERLQKDQTDTLTNQIIFISPLLFPPHPREIFRRQSEGFLESARKVELVLEPHFVRDLLGQFPRGQ